jgi:cobalt-zinc-cadmium efflux system protein
MSNGHHHPHHSEHAHHHLHAKRDHHLLVWPLLLISGFAIVEALGGWLTGSLALLGDAGHMASDAAALGLALLGAWVARRPPTLRHSFGLMRAEVLVALLNGLLMLGVVAAIVIEAIARMQAPQPVAAGGVMLIASIGLMINVVVAVHLHRGQHTINHRAALLHVIGDLLGSVAALMAGVIIFFTGWNLIDPILSVLISLLILFSTLKLLREVLHMLMEGVPAHLDAKDVRQRLVDVQHVQDIRNFRLWSLSSEEIACTAHVSLSDMSKWPQVLHALQHILQTEFEIQHITLQPETSSLDTHSHPEESLILKHE